MTNFIFQKRFLPLGVCIVGAIACFALSIAQAMWLMIPGIILAALSALGVYDLMQTRHAVLRNYPVIGHIRYLLESIRPEIRQYLLEGDRDEEPFSRETRSLVYQRAKGVEDKKPFGTSEKVYDSGYAWVTHSMMPKHIADTNFRVLIGGPNCAQPYNASIYNISAMSFGALSANAISALNKGAKEGGFAHDTGEGGISTYHRQGGDLIYQVASGYFGCRADDGTFDVGKFKLQAAEPQVKLPGLKSRAS